MLFVKRLLTLFLFCVFVLSSSFISATYTTLSEWTLANQQGKFSGQNSVLTANEFLDVLENCRRAIRERVFDKPDLWLKNNTPTNSFFQADLNNECYLQKLVVDPGSKICFMGDIHGSVDSLLHNLNKLASNNYIADNFKIINDNFYMIFLGDYIDRGVCGVEVLSILSLLKIANPDTVFLLRGNHEEPWQVGTFEKELEAKFKWQDQDVQKAVLETAKCFPAAIFLKSGTNFAQCCHGGIELWYSPCDFMASDKMFERYIKHKEIFREKECLFEFGFIWSDFDFLGKEDREYQKSYEFSVRGGNALIFHREKTKKYLAKNSTPENRFVAFFRGHQHAFFGLKMFNEHHKNIGSLGFRAHWENIVSEEDVRNKEISIAAYHPVFTFSTAAGVSSCYQPYDCYGILTVEKEYENWTLKVHEEMRTKIRKSDLKFEKKTVKPGIKKVDTLYDFEFNQDLEEEGEEAITLEEAIKNVGESPDNCMFEDVQLEDVQLVDVSFEPFNVNKQERDISCCHIL
ncbi:MAG: metallophosphoesterase family protein [bacterium]